jgi:hypothetical protein
MPEHVRMHSRHSHASRGGQTPQPASRGVAVHPVAVAVEQDRAASTVADGAVDRPPHSRRQRDQRELGAFAQHA